MKKIQRKIKFRAWDKELEFMRFFELHEINGRPVPKDWEIMQYTGLKDKNGKEIYEGDILKSKRLNAKGEVKFGKAHFFILTRNGAAMGWELSPNTDELEVIGNIYENPELIKI